MTLFWCVSGAEGEASALGLGVSVGVGAGIAAAAAPAILGNLQVTQALESWNG